MSGRGLLVLLASGVALAGEPPALPPGAVARLGSARLRHAERPLCVTFSPDGKSVVTGGEDGAIRVWSVATGEQLATTRKPEAAVVAVQFTHNNTRLAANFTDGYLRFLDPITLEEREAVEAPNTTEFALSPDGTLLATIRPGGDLHVHDLAADLPRLELPGGPLVRFRPDGKAIAVTGEKGVATVYHCTGGKPLHVAAHGGMLNGLAFRPDGKWLATAGWQPRPTVKVWEPGKAEPVAVLDGATGPIAFVGNGKLAAVRGLAVGIWDFAEGKWVQFVRDATGAFAVSPDGTKLAATGTGGLRVRLWDLTTDTQLHATDDAIPDSPLMVPTADGKVLFVAAGSRAFHWPLDGTKAVPAGMFPGTVIAAAVSDGANRRLVASTDRGLAVWDDFDPAKAMLPKPSREVDTGGTVVRTVAVSSDGTRAAFAGDDRKTVLFDPATGKVMAALPGEAGALALAFTPDGHRLLTHGRDGFLRLWELAEGEGMNGNAEAAPSPGTAAPFRPLPRGRGGNPAVSEPPPLWGRSAEGRVGGSVLPSPPEGEGGGAAPPGEGNSARSVPSPARHRVTLALFPKGRGEKTPPTLTLPYKGGGDKTHLSPGGEVAGRSTAGEGVPTSSSTVAPRELWKARVQRGPFGALAVSPDGRQVAASSAVRLVVLDTTDGSLVYGHDRESEDGPIRGVAFSPDGRLLLAAYTGPVGSVKVWDTATRQRVRRFSTGLGGVTRLVVFPDGTRAATGGTDEAVTVWALPARDR